MNKIFVVSGTRYSTDVEIWHTRTDLFHNIIGIYSTKTGTPNRENTLPTW